MGTIRERSNGTFELRVTHRVLPKPYYTTHASRPEAEGYDARLKRMLDRGDVPPELREKPKDDRRRTPLGMLLGTYLEAAPIAYSDRGYVEGLHRTLAKPNGLCGITSLEQITVKWCDDWVRDMKRTDRLAPGTIRKKVESLARAVDWWNRREHALDEIPSNPLRMMPRGYSAYGKDDGEAVVDVQRDRRLTADEEVRIEAAIMGEKRPDRQRPLEIPDRPLFLLFYRLIVNTGLRLREAYRLRPIDIKHRLKTIHVPPGKTGRARDVPMTPQVLEWLSVFKKREKSTALCFPYWSGEEEDLERCTGRLSMQFRSIFSYAHIEDLTEHDLRHEATCRWMLMKDTRGRWLFRPEEVRRITGHRNVQQFERYLSLRGSDLAERMWETEQ